MKLVTSVYISIFASPPLKKNNIRHVRRLRNLPEHSYDLQLNIVRFQSQINGLLYVVYEFCSSPPKINLGRKYRGLQTRTNVCDAVPHD